jgi:hypothetical protein
MNLKALLISFFLFGILNEVHAQSSPEDISNKFFNIYKKASFDKGLDYLFSTNQYAKEYQPELDTIKHQVTYSVQLVGAFLDYELISQKKAGNSMILLTYLVKCERDALTFRILFYKPINTWQAQSFNFDNKIGEELESASKTYTPSN